MKFGLGGYGKKAWCFLLKEVSIRHIAMTRVCYYFALGHIFSPATGGWRACLPRIELFHLLPNWAVEMWEALGL